jgi:hypothetical protein
MESQRPLVVRGPSVSSTEPVTTTSRSDKSTPADWPPVLSPGEVAARIAIKREFVKNRRPPQATPFDPLVGLRRSHPQAPISSDVFSPTSQWSGANLHGMLIVWAGSRGRDDPMNGAILLQRLDATDGSIRGGHLQGVPGAGVLYIESAESYGRLSLIDNAGKRYQLDATADPTSIVAR